MPAIPSVKLGSVHSTPPDPLAVMGSASKGEGREERGEGNGGEENPPKVKVSRRKHCLSTARLIVPHFLCANKTLSVKPEVHNVLQAAAMGSIIVCRNGKYRSYSQQLHSWAF